MLLTDGSPEANRLAGMEEASNCVRGERKRIGRKTGRKGSD